jgi:hypothetical protein
MADKAVQAFRQWQAAVGVVITEPMEWEMEDFIMASHARLALVGDFLVQLLVVVAEVFKVLWPGIEVPTSAVRLSKWLAAALGRIDEWRASAA